MRRLPKTGYGAELAQRVVERAEAALANARAEAENVLAQAKRALERASEAFYDLGEAFVRLREERLYRALGFDSFEALLADELGVSRSYAYHLAGVATQLRREQAVALGPAKATALVRLASVTPEFDTAASLYSARVSLPRRREKVEVSKLTLRELQTLVRERTRRQRPPGKRVREADRQEALARANRLREKLEDAGVEDARVRVVERRTGPQETLRLRVELPMGSLGALAKVLSRFR
jgi:hypothetical protein